MPKKSNPKNDHGTGAFSLLGTASTMGMHMVSAPIVGGLLGWLIDRWLDSWPVGAAVGLILGIIAGFRMVFADARAMRRQQEMETLNDEYSDSDESRPNN